MGLNKFFTSTNDGSQMNIVADENGLDIHVGDDAWEFTKEQWVELSALIAAAQKEGE